VDVENPRGQLLPGAYVSVHLTVPKAIRSVTVPANTLLFRVEGLQVGVVRHGQAELIPVTIGRDYGNTVEVVSGLQPTDSVIIDPADSLITGTPVQIKEQPGGGATPWPPSAVATRYPAGRSADGCFCRGSAPDVDS
jgi:multidrug efflux pump subunit AcrA (membrane-fusion protein)